MRVTVTSHGSDPTKGSVPTGVSAQESTPCPVEKAMELLVASFPFGLFCYGRIGMGWMGFHPFPWAAVAFGWGMKYA